MPILKNNVNEWVREGTSLFHGVFRIDKPRFGMPWPGEEVKLFNVGPDHSMNEFVRKFESLFSAQRYAEQVSVGQKLQLQTKKRRIQEKRRKKKNQKKRRVA